MMRATTILGLLLLAGCYDRETACFVRGTLVRTPAGDVPIETLREGDEVLSFRPEDGAIVRRRVLATLRNATRRVRVLTVGGRKIVTTDEHPFWDAERRAWVPAQDVARGTVLVQLLDDGTTRPAVVEDVHIEVRVEPVFNLTVEGPEHTYFAAGIAVHNKTRAHVSPPPAEVVLVNETGASLSVTTRPVDGLEIDVRLLADGIPLTLGAAALPGTDTLAVVPVGAPLHVAHSSLRVTDTWTRDAILLGLPGDRRYLVVGEGELRIGVAGPMAGPGVSLQRLVPEGTSCAAGETKSAFEAPAERLSLGDMKLTAQTKVDGCLSVTLEPKARAGEAATTTTLRLCLPEGAWPFAVGDMLDTVESEPSLHSLFVASATNQLSVFRQNGTLDRFEPTWTATCSTMDRCGLPRAPAALYDAGKERVLERGQSTMLDDGRKLFVLGGYRRTIASTSCGDDEDTGIDLAVVGPVP